MFSFSIVIVTYGRQRELEDLLDSIVDQPSVLSYAKLLLLITI